MGDEEDDDSCEDEDEDEGVSDDDEQEHSEGAEVRGFAGWNIQNGAGGTHGGFSLAEAAAAAAARERGEKLAQRKRFNAAVKKVKSASQSNLRNPQDAKSWKLQGSNSKTSKSVDVASTSQVQTQTSQEAEAQNTGEQTPHTASVADANMMQSRREWNVDEVNKLKQSHASLANIHEQLQEQRRKEEAERLARKQKVLANLQAARQNRNLKRQRQRTVAVQEDDLDLSSDSSWDSDSDSDSSNSSSDSEGDGTKSDVDMAQDDHDGRQDDGGDKKEARRARRTTSGKKNDKRKRRELKLQKMLQHQIYEAQRVKADAARQRERERGHRTTKARNSNLSGGSTANAVSNNRALLRQALRSAARFQSNHQGGFGGKKGFFGGKKGSGKKGKGSVAPSYQRRARKKRLEAKACRVAMEMFGGFLPDPANCGSAPSPLMPTPFPLDGPAGKTATNAKGVGKKGGFGKKGFGKSKGPLRREQEHEQEPAVTSDLNGMAGEFVPGQPFAFGGAGAMNINPVPTPTTDGAMGANVADVDGVNINMGPNLGMGPNLSWMRQEIRRRKQSDIDMCVRLSQEQQMRNFQALQVQQFLAWSAGLSKSYVCQQT